MFQVEFTLESEGERRRDKDNSFVFGNSSTTSFHLEDMYSIAKFDLRAHVYEYREGLNICFEYLLCFLFSLKI